MVSVEASEEGGLAFLFLWENTAEEFVQLFLLFPLLSLYLTLRIPPYFFLENTSIPNLHEVKENMTMGTTLVTNPSGGFLVSGRGGSSSLDTSAGTSALL